MKARIVVNFIGIILILTLTVLVLFNDIIRYSDDILSMFSRIFK